MKKSNTDNKKIDNTSETETKKNNKNNYEKNSENIKNENLSNDLFYEKEIDDGNNKSINSYNNNEEDDEDKNQLKKEENISNIKANSLLNIFLVDIDGNINYYNDIGIKTLFNINKIKEIDKGARERGLFSLNYSYIIKYSHPYLTIFTDNGCYLFQLKHI